MSTKSTRLNGKTVQLVLPELHPGQLPIYNSKARFRTVCAGRRFGKTVLGERELIENALLENHYVAWVSPSYKQLLDVWREVTAILDPILKRSNAQDKRLELENGSIIDFFSLENFESIRGKRYHFICVDECAQYEMLSEAWSAAIRPSLADFKGKALFISTPRSRNFFYTAYLRGRSDSYPDWESFTASTYANPYIDPSEIEAAKQELPTRIFEQEFLAQFSLDLSGCFRGVYEAATSTPLDSPVDGHDYYAGLDLALQDDYTALIVTQAPCNLRTCKYCNVGQYRQVWLDRFNKTDMAQIKSRTKEICKRYKVKTMLVDSTGLGLVPVGELSDHFSDIDTHVEGFNINGVSKGQIVVSLEIAIEKKEIALLNDPVLVDEHMAYEMKKSDETGRVKYSAPPGMHDDTVVASMLSFKACEVGRVWYVDDLLTAEVYQDTTNVWTMQNRGYFWNAQS